MTLRTVLNNPGAQSLGVTAQQVRPKVCAPTVCNKIAFAVLKNMSQSDITVLSQPNDKEMIKQFFYQVPLIERAKPLIGELIWILQDRPDLDMHKKVLPDYCYNVMDVFKRTLFKSFPLLTDTIYVMDQAGLESTKNVEEAKKPSGLTGAIWGDCPVWGCAVPGSANLKRKIN